MSALEIVIFFVALPAAYFGLWSLIQVAKDDRLEAELTELIERGEH